MCSPQTITPDDVVPTDEAIVRRQKAKREFLNEVQKKKLWVMMLERYGMAIFLVLTAILREDQQVPFRRVAQRSESFLYDLREGRFDRLSNICQHIRPFGATWRLLSIMGWVEGGGTRMAGEHELGRMVTRNSCGSDWAVWNFRQTIYQTNE